MLKHMKRFITLVLILSPLWLFGCQQQKPKSEVLQEVFPPVEITNAALFRVNNLPVTPDFFKDRWTLLVFNDDNGCADPCLQRLQLIDAVEGAQTLMFAPGLPDHGRQRELAAQFPGIGFTSGTTASSAERFHAQFEVDFIEAGQKAQYIYLINPSAELEYAVSAQQLSREALM